MRSSPSDRWGHSSTSLHAVGGELQAARHVKPEAVRARNSATGGAGERSAHGDRGRGRPFGDEATVDVLRIVARRIAGCPALVLITFRDDELDRHHPLRGLLGELSLAGASRRVDLQPLSPAAVAVLARAYHFDPDDPIGRRTATPSSSPRRSAGTAGVPDTVRDAVLARAARLTPYGP